MLVQHGTPPAMLVLAATADALVPSWQQQLDRVFLDIDMKPRTRSRTLFKVLERREKRS